MKYARIHPARIGVIIHQTGYRLRYSFLFIILSAITACELVVDVAVPLEKPVVTLNAYFTPDSLWRAKLSLSRHILDEAPFAGVEDALVVIYHEHIPVDTLVHQEHGFYAGKSKPEAGKIYEIMAASKTNDTVRSTSSVPTPVTIQSVTVDRPQIPVGDEPKIGFKIQFKDRPAEENYYQLMVEVESSYRNPATGQVTKRNRPIHLESRDPAIDDENLDSYEGLYFKDVLFEGRDITLSLEGYYWEIGGGNPIKLTFYLRTISKDYYSYRTTSLLQDFTSGDPFAQPVSVYSNIENGFGIFSGYSETVFVYEK